MVRPDPDGPVDLRVDVFVDGRADLVFNFGVPYRRETIGGPSEDHVGSSLDAQRLVPIRITQRGDVRVSGVRFRLGGLGAFVEPLRPWTNRTPPPSMVFGPDAEALERSLAAELDLDAHAALYDAFFLRRLRTEGSYASFSPLLEALVRSDGASPIETLAELGRVSARHVDRLFGRHLGFPPKTAARIVRFQIALRSLMKDPEVPLGSVATTAGYFDQSHFIRDFRRMTGGVPRGYRGYFPPDGPADFAPNVVAFVQDERRR